MTTETKLRMVNVFKAAKAARWTRDKIDSLSTAEVQQLRFNAERLEETEIVALCDDVLGVRPRGGGSGRTQKGNGRNLVSRSKAFEMRGVYLQNPIWSRGGVRSSDGAVLMTIWAEDVRSEDGGCSYLLWAPNANGSRPWSDKAGGKERLEHCRLAAQQGKAEGLLVYGKKLEGSLPDDKAHSIDGVDAEIVLNVRVEKRGDEYWATWGKSKP